MFLLGNTACFQLRERSADPNSNNPLICSYECIDGWNELTAHVLRPGRYKHTKTEKGRTTVEYELHGSPEENYARGPFADSTSDTDFESYLWQQTKKPVDDLTNLSEEDLKF